MVLESLGGRIAGALRKMSNATVIDEDVLNSMLGEIARALLEADVNVKTVAALRRDVRAAVDLESVAAGVNKRRLIQKCVFDAVAAMLTPARKPVALKKGKPNVVMFVGLQGNGKTTSCVKYAYWHKRRGWKTCVVCADTFRAGAFDQLKQGATKAKIPFYGSYTETDPVTIAADGVATFRKEGYELIIVDTSGRHMQEAALFDEMAAMEAAVSPDEVVFVMDSSIGQAAQDQAAAFRDKVKVGSIVVTKLDGNAKGGGALSAVSATGAPITFIGTGEHTDAFEPFNPQTFVGRLLGMGDISGLVSSMKDAGIEENPDLYKRIADGVFTLRDMYEQFENIKKLGPMNKVMSMMPGMSELIPKGANESEGNARINMFLCIMDSMCNEELDNPKIQFTQSRIYRIARGSGRMPQHVEELLIEYKRFSKVVEKMGKMKGVKNGQINMNDLQRNMPAQLSSVMDPALLKKMGGASGMQNMIKQLSQHLPQGK
mmetsp:Transcript_16046/g.43028  ORF Transcript_16046/g.43028 Transcript_16046/m.43028 type:complete len:488 (-) Transcript_16046:62-1525(-)|eukprot:CAMPEP_0184736362 /NCGR_PEP_ID=MMETSP0314-20130426/62361_1 /TAXON_ID=38298 /ORGANISM="Rhodella maculata, Strain CCMP 736" /LENGTH=487 /DNA_ID=CAMNT_0027203419 /DNA_START=68 /DNA_END=1531 /DNA_ORIENTATION=-